MSLKPNGLLFLIFILFLSFSLKQALKRKKKIKEKLLEVLHLYGKLNQNCSYSTKIIQYLIIES